MVERPAKKGSQTDKHHHQADERRNRKQSKPDQCNQDPVEDEPKIDRSKDQRTTHRGVTPFSITTQILDPKRKRDQANKGGDKKMKRRK
jgi:hypothetical protein